MRRTAPTTTSTGCLRGWRSSYGAAPAPIRTAAERILLDAAHQHEPNIVTKLGREIHARLDQDGPPPDHRDLHRPHRSLDRHETAEGRVYGRFDLAPETGSLLTNLLSPHTTPDNSSADGPDLRTKLERDADGLAEILRLAAANENSPTEAGKPVALLVTVGLEQLERGVGAALLDSGAPMSAAQVRRMACDAQVIPSVLGSRAELLDIGRKQRTIPTPIRRALLARDQGCAFPGCSRKPKWCQGHHIWHWVDGGPTELNNLVLVCTRHHMTIHHTDWQVRIHYTCEDHYANANERTEPLWSVGPRPSRLAPPPGTQPVGTGVYRASSA
ncbi:MAG: DUF222 domain-containing protein [Actinophytocola sp.]|nr:DUF222 domain-containing protein [Actinophytocola sp.]